MTGRHALIGLVLLYVAMDFANPMIPGAFEFDPAESVEGLRGERGRVIVPADLPAPNPRVAGVAVETPEARRLERAAPSVLRFRLFVQARRAYVTASSDPASPADDH